MSSYIQSCFSGFPFCLFPDTFGSDLKTVGRPVEIDKYMGTWYEIARKPMKQQASCLESQAQYTFDKERKQINVLNSCKTISGGMKQASAFAIPKSEDNNKLNVYFTQYMSGNYWILDLDPDYKWAIVGEPCRKYAWILSRETEMDKDSIKNRLKTLEDAGYGVYDMIFRGESQ